MATNFGNMFGEMEVMKYVAGMIAGSRAKADGATRVGGMATFPIPEELRLFNAYALGVQETCPECDVDIRWIFTWHDPIIEREGADSLFDAGSHVVMTGADTPASALAAADREGVYGITYDWVGSCTIDECLTAPYWVWGPVFVRNRRRSSWLEPIHLWQITLMPPLAALACTVSWKDRNCSLVLPASC